MLYADVRSKISLARERFRRGEEVPDGCVRREILESWRRSRGYGLHFEAADKTLLPPEALSERINERRGLVDIALPFMERLHDFITGSGFLAILADEEGYVLKTMGDVDISRQARENLLVEGCNRSERRLGTNGIGTALAIGGPIQVFAEEHFYELHHQWVCSGAPIFDPEGKPMGVFCLTGRTERVSFHTLGLAAAAAAAISQQAQMQQAYDVVERIQRRSQVIVETVPSGILLLNKNLEITQINMRASVLLMLPPAQIVGKSLKDILDRPDLTLENLYNEIDDQNITVERNGNNLHFTFTLSASSTDEYVVTFVKTEVLHKKISKIIGSEARFSFDDIIGGVPAMRNAISLARIAARNTSTVLLTGESGTGKELFAQSIHNASSRRDGPFVALNCGALPKSLIESELFGYESGTFTGARREGSAGKFELANGGTIFLDEIGDMPFDVQASLLRVLQNREVSRLGSTKATRIDVRVIAATNKELLTAIENKSFRDDLYYRLNVFNIHVPPLRERVADIRLLADYFLRKYAQYTSKSVQGFTEEAYRALEAHPWRGNIRELENLVERAVYVSRAGQIGCESLNLAPAPHGGLSPAVSGTVEGDLARPAVSAARSASVSRRFVGKDVLGTALEDALRQSGGNMKQAAELLGMSRRTLYRKLDALGLDADTLRERVSHGS